MPEGDANIEGPISPPAYGFTAHGWAFNERR